MNGDTISYRYTQHELVTLSEMLGCQLPGLPLPQLSDSEVEQAMASLENGGYLVPAGKERAGVDRLTALLISQIARCRRFIRVETGANRLSVLWECPDMFLLGSMTRLSMVTLTPLIDAEAGQEALSEAALRHRMPSEVVTGDASHEEEPVTVNSEDQLAAAVEAFFTGSRPGSARKPEKPETNDFEVN